MQLRPVAPAPVVAPGLFCLFLLAVLSSAAASGTTLYSTSFEVPEFTEGPLGTQGGWTGPTFGTDPTVTSDLARTGDQSLVVSGSDAAFGQSELFGPSATPAPQIAIEY